MVAGSMTNFYGLYYSWLTSSISLKDLSKINATLNNKKIATLSMVLMPSFRNFSIAILYLAAVAVILFWCNVQMAVFCTLGVGYTGTTSSLVLG